MRIITTLLVSLLALLLTSNPSYKEAHASPPSDAVIQTINFGDGPWGVASSSNGLLYVVNHGSVGGNPTPSGGAQPNTLSIIDAESGTLVSSQPMGPRPVSVTLDSNRSQMFVGGSFYSILIQVNSPQNSATIPISNNQSGQAFSADGTRLYVASFKDIVVFSTKSATEEKRVSLSDYISGLVLSPDGQTIFALGKYSGVIYVIDSATLSVNSTISTGDNGSLLEAELSGDGSRLYVSDESDGVYVIDAINRIVLGLITFGRYQDSWALAISKDGSRLYVTSTNRNLVSVVNTQSNTVMGSIPVQSNPRGIAINESGTRAYVTNLSSNSISVIDLLKPIPQLPVAPTNPKAVAGKQQAMVMWTRSKSTGVYRVTEYEVSATPGSQKCRSQGSRCKVTGLLPGVTYRFEIRARNAYGLSPKATTRSVKMPAPSRPNQQQPPVPPPSLKPIPVFN